MFKQGNAKFSVSEAVEERPECHKPNVTSLEPEKVA